MDESILFTVIKYFFIAVGVGILLWCIVNYRKVQAFFGTAMPRFFREVKVEMQKVAWPSQNDVIGSTIAVLTAVVFIGAIIAVTDKLLGWVMSLLIFS